MCDIRYILLAKLSFYSPDFNPIEYSFSKLKALIKRKYQMAYDYAERGVFIEFL
jgi:transposase